jgi:pullulanase
MIPAPRRSGSSALAALALVAWAVLAHAQDAAPLDDCNGPPSTLLQPARQPPARAVASDARHLRWPGVEARGLRLRLLHSAAARIVATPGEAAQGADRAWLLRLVPRPPATARRFGWVGAGVDLALPAGVPLHGQLVLVAEDAQGRVQQASGVQHAALLDARHAAAAALGDLGVSVGRGRTAWRLWAPTAQRVDVCVHPRAGAPASVRLAMRRDRRTGAWSAMLPRDLSGASYRYLVDVFAPAAGLVRNRVTDPYAVSLDSDSRHSFIADLASPALKPPGWDGHTRPAPARSATEMAVYELHVRDFSAADTTVPPPHRGRYLAFTHAASAGMQHLKALAEAGLTDVHLLPVFDFATVPETGCVTPQTSGAPDGTEQQAAVSAVAASDCFNWGYDPWHFGAPEGSYATDAADGALRIVELRRMVQALHAAGLRVGMDVVYNHTSASGQDPKSVLDRIVPGYYHRLDADGAVERSTCCDNTATEHRMMAKLMLDTAERWVRHYGIDSFRFDLMGHQPRAAMRALQRRLPGVPLIGEGWNFGEVADGRRFVQASQLSLGGWGIATFSDRARDALRGGSAGDNGIVQLQRQGWINGLFHDPNEAAAGRATRDDLLHAADLMRVGLAGTLRRYAFVTRSGERRRSEHIDYAGQPAGYASQPSEVVNYAENHDNQTLFDSNVFKLPRRVSAAERARVQALANAVVAFSQGVAYFHAGQEILRSKSMDRNSFDSGDAFNRIDWTLQDNGFGRGLPPQGDNGESWPWMRPLLADAAIKPAPEHIRWSRDAFVDLLKMRAGTSLFHLRSADEVQRRLVFHNTGPEQVPTVIVGQLDGRGLAGANFAELVYLINADRQPVTLELPALKDKAYVLHPVQRARAPAGAAYDAASGRFTLPARAAVVYVVEPGAGPYGTGRRFPPP